MKSIKLQIGKKLLTYGGIFIFGSTMAQTNVFDNVIATSPNHTSLTAAINTAGLANVLRSADSSYTIFAPDNNAFNELAINLGTNITGLLALPNLSGILTYHVLGTRVAAAAINNGAIVSPLNQANTIKLTKTSTNVFANQAEVNAADLNADNGVVHSLNSVLLPFETVVDIAIDNGFTSLVAVVVKAELLPALTNPFDTFTVFAPDNNAFNELAAGLGLTLAQVLALNIEDIQELLYYHLLPGNVLAAAITNGAIVQPVSQENTLKLTKTTSNKVFINQAEVIIPNLAANNGTVHAINSVLVFDPTVVDVAIDAGFTTLTAALFKAELIPTLSRPFDSFTVFAPTNAAFDSFAIKNNLTLAQVLALPGLANLLKYHVVSGKILASELRNGLVPTLNTKNVKVNVTSGVKINFSTVTTADIEEENGVVHIINAVLDENALSTKISNAALANIYPNPVANLLKVKGIENFEFSIYNTLGQLILSGNSINDEINVSKIAPGNYQLIIVKNNVNYQSQFTK